MKHYKKPSTAWITCSTTSLQKCFVLLGVLSVALTFALLIRVEDLHSLQQDRPHSVPDVKSRETVATTQDVQSGKERLWDILSTMNYTDMVDNETWSKVPTWAQIEKLHGKKPVVIGLDTCQNFRDAVPEEERLIGPAGLQNTGTNLLAELMKLNCQNAARVNKLGAKRGHGNLWQVPWSKHAPLSLRNYTAQGPEFQSINKDYVLPVAAVRAPYEWFNSMCHNNYNTRWTHRGVCPNLVLANNSYVPVMTQYFRGSVKLYHKTLAHLWNEWNNEYLLNTTWPRLLVRHADLVFYPKETTELVCKCAGGALNENFQYVMMAAKGNRKGAKPFDGLVGNWIKYGREFNVNQYSKRDMKVAKQVLDQNIMKLFGFRIPS